MKKSQAMKFISPRHTAVPAFAMLLSVGGCAGAPQQPAAQTAGLRNVATDDGGCSRSRVANRIPRSGEPCSAAGRSYSNEEIARTGATTTGEALRLLDPAITVHR